MEYGSVDKGGLMSMFGTIPLSHAKIHALKAKKNPKMLQLLKQAVLSILLG